MHGMIVTDNLWRAYGDRVVLHGLTLDVAAGEILGFLGPNGAGKSTTVKILTGMIKPDGGRASVAGFDVVREPLQVKQRIGYVPESAALYESLSAREYLDLIASLHHLPRESTAHRIEELLDRFELSNAIDQRLSEFSKGMKQKVLIASALMHRPDVLFLDEPLTGLDANAALVVKELIRGLAAQGRTIFFCSHVLEVVERVCTRIVIINEGKIIAAGTAPEIAAAAGVSTLEQAFVALTGTRDAALVTRDLLEALER
jgi:ABC-2 type transport system ATP-binding protein